MQRQARLVAEVATTHGGVDRLARTSAGVVFEDRGEHDLKGIAEPQRLFAVKEQE